METTKKCPKCGNTMGIRCIKCYQCGYDYFKDFDKKINNNYDRTIKK